MLLFGGCPGHCQMLSIIPGLYPSYPPPIVITRNDGRGCPVSSGGGVHKHPPGRLWYMRALRRAERSCEGVFLGVCVQCVDFVHSDALAEGTYWVPRAISSSKMWLGLHQASAAWLLPLYQGVSWTLCSPTSDLASGYGGDLRPVPVLVSPSVKWKKRSPKGCR